jgi:hypothetical protein
VDSNLTFMPFTPFTKKIKTTGDKSVYKLCIHANCYRNFVNLLLFTGSLFGL